MLFCLSEIWILWDMKYLMLHLATLGTLKRKAKRSVPMAGPWKTGSSD